MLIYIDSTIILPLSHPYLQVIVASVMLLPEPYIDPSVQGLRENNLLQLWRQRFLITKGQVEMKDDMNYRKSLWENYTEPGKDSYVCPEMFYSKQSSGVLKIIKQKTKTSDNVFLWEKYTVPGRDRVLCPEIFGVKKNLYR